MKVIIFLGPPGVGKGTQCSLLSARLGVKHISTGAIIRQEIASESALGLKVKLSRSHANASGGKLTIEFYSESDLQEVFRKLIGEV